MTKNSKKRKINENKYLRMCKKTMYQKNMNQLKAKKEPFLKLVYITY